MLVSTSNKPVLLFIHKQSLTPKKCQKKNTQSTKKPLESATNNLSNNTYTTFSLGHGYGVFLSTHSNRFFPNHCRPVIHRLWLFTRLTYGMDDSTVCLPYLFSWYFFAHLNQQKISFTPSLLLYAVSGFYLWALLSLVWSTQDRFESMISLLDWGAGTLLFLIAL